MNYYIADLHIGCRNSYENRTLEHDNILKDNWNKTVTNADTVYILGDIGMLGNNRNNEYVASVISQLKGKNKVLIVGNHDVKGLKDPRISQLFTEITYYKEITDNYNGMNHNIVLCHEPFLFWNNQHKSWIHLYGHLHNSDEEMIYQKCLNQVNDYFKDRELKGYTDCPPAKAYNVGVMLDYIDYTPRTLKEILQGSDRKYENIK